ncbi:transposase IS116/IS110/IS902 family protein [Arthrobacter sp. Hiyo8]|nr:transposase IS116/IS110/IS902 family protein [Arthrobacter sp. Hiyo8]
MRTVACSHPFVIGVDTHARTHTYAVIAASGEHLGIQAFPNTHAGRNRAIALGSHAALAATSVPCGSSRAPAATGPCSRAPSEGRGTGSLKP